LDDLDELAGYVAAEANHAKIKKIEKELRQLYARIAAVLESYTDENNGCGFAQMMKVGVQKVKVWTPKDET
jgi:hypothetical protein